jgi:hypothetical protein
MTARHPKDRAPGLDETGRTGRSSRLVTLTSRRLAALLLPALLLTSSPAAHAGPSGIDTGFTLQGRIAYDCYGCGSTATFTGVATYAGDNGIVTVPASGPLEVGEYCTDNGSAYGTLRIGDTDYVTWLSRTRSAAVVSSYGPAGWTAPDTGGGTLTIDGPAGTCGVPATATLTAVLVPFFNCACSVAGDD